MNCVVHRVAKSWTQLRDFHTHYLSKGLGKRRKARTDVRSKKENKKGREEVAGWGGGGGATCPYAKV